MLQGDLVEADRLFSVVTKRAEAAEDRAAFIFRLVGHAAVLAHLGQVASGRAAAESAIEAAEALGGFYGDTVYAVAGLGAQRRRRC
jgi:hypothetical protein